VGPQCAALAVIAGLVAGAGVFMTTAKGRETREFLVRIALRAAQGRLADPPGNHPHDLGGDRGGDHHEPDPGGFDFIVIQGDRSCSSGPDGR
jgi:hypothetical protein